MQRYILALAVVVLVAWPGLTGCAGPAAPRMPARRAMAPPPTATPQPADDMEAIRQLILLEAQGVCAKTSPGSSTCGRPMRW
ncbi:MAG: hypothetical protein ACP5UQ_02355 [Anaerolineae bacterium]